MMGTGMPSEEASHMPMPIPIAEAWHVLLDVEADSEESVHGAAFQTITILEARGTPRWT